MSDDEQQALQELYAEARAAGATLTVYAGGDTPAQQDSTVAEFTAAFPEIELNMIVDYSKYHDVRIDRQAAVGDLIPDVTHLQTSFDFTRWKERGLLAPFQPVGFDRVHPLLKDPDGFWFAVNVFAFSYMHGPSGGPATPRELIDARWRGEIASSHPGDDDATLFLFKAYVDAYGWEWLEALADQQIAFHRGTNTPGEAVAAGRKLVGVAGAWDGDPGVTWVIPPTGHPFLAWGQRAALLADAPHPAAGRLYLSWSISAARQAASYNGWSVRTDTDLPLSPAWDTPDAHLADFVAFMDDRAEVERWRQTLLLYLGEVHGEPTPGWLGLRPQTRAEGALTTRSASPPPTRR